MFHEYDLGRRNGLGTAIGISLLVEIFVLLGIYYQPDSRSNFPFYSVNCVRSGLLPPSCLSFLNEVVISSILSVG